MSTATIQPVAYLLSFRSTFSLIPIAVALLDELPQTAIYVFPPTRSFPSQNYAWDTDWKLVLMQSEPFSPKLISSIKDRDEEAQIITHRTLWQKNDMNKLQEHYRAYNLNHLKVV